MARTRVLVKVLLVLALVTGLAGGLVSWATPDQPWCKVTSSWAKTVKTQDLPKNLEEFLEIPTKYRIAIWPVLSPQVRAQIMRDTYQFAIDSGKLNDAQVAFAKKSKDRLTDEYVAENARLKAEALAAAKAVGEKFELQRGDLLAIEDEQLFAEQKRLFPATSEAARLINPMALPQRLPKQVAWVLPTVREQLMNLLTTTTVGAVDAGQCGCRFTWKGDTNEDTYCDWPRCPETGSCDTKGEVSCDPVNVGCGYNWDWPCNKKCKCGTDAE